MIFIPMFMTYSWIVHDFYSFICFRQMSSGRKHYIINLWCSMTCLWLDHDLFMTCSWLVHDLFMTCSWLVHDLFMTCLLLVHGRVGESRGNLVFPGNLKVSQEILIVNPTHLSRKMWYTQNNPNFIRNKVLVTEKILLVHRRWMLIAKEGTNS